MGSVASKASTSASRAGITPAVRLSMTASPAGELSIACYRNGRAFRGELPGGSGSDAPSGRRYENDPVHAPTSIRSGGLAEVVTLGWVT